MTSSRWLLPILVTVFVHTFVAALPLHFKQNKQERPPAIAFRLVQLPVQQIPVAEKAPTPTPTKTIKPPPTVRHRAPKPLPAPPLKVSPQKPKPPTSTNSVPVPTTVPSVPPPLPAIPVPRKSSRANLIAYGKNIHAAVMRHRRYPQAAKRLHLEGRAMVRITLDLRGHLLRKPVIHSSSGHEVLDREALHVVQKTAPFGALPDGVNSPSVTMVIPVQFYL